MFNLYTPVELKVTASDTWATVDRTVSTEYLLADILPSNTSGVFLHIYSSESQNIGLRKVGSTDARTGDMTDSHLWTAVGVDSSNNFEIYFGSAIAQEVWLVGYVTDDSATFFTNAYDKTPASMDSWEDVDLSTECPGATGIIFETERNGGGVAIGVRKNGSSDDRYVGIRHMWGVIGCDSGQGIECYTSESASEKTYLYIIGYITANATFNTNADDITLTGTASYTDIDLSAKTNGILAFVEVHCPEGLTKDVALRTDGSSEDMYHGMKHAWAIIGMPTSGLIEGKIEDVRTDFFLVGYARLTRYPSDPTTRVTSIIHRYSSGNYSMELLLGDVQTDWATVIPSVDEETKPTSPIEDTRTDEEKIYDIQGERERELEAREYIYKYMRERGPVAPPPAAREEQRQRVYGIEPPSTAPETPIERLEQRRREAGVKKPTGFLGGIRSWLQRISKH